ncbi:MAG TPA: DUF2306 domain-containing protein [Gemmatimonadales bacterium]|nr:DUF2306 domain-containing protein [Gemmatimonadales bacterium]
MAAVLALVVGGVQLVRPKGTAPHRRLGWVYALLVLALNGSALFVYRETGSWNRFHWLAVLSLVTLLVALGGFVVFGRRWWVPHAYVMAGSYLGIVLAGLLQLATHVPAGSTVMSLAWILTGVLTGWLFLHKVPADVRHMVGEGWASRLSRACG